MNDEEKHALEKEEVALTPNIGLVGMFNVDILDPDGSVVGRSGWTKNVFTDSGMYALVSDWFNDDFAITGVDIVRLGTSTTTVTYTTSDLPGSQAVTAPYATYVTRTTDSTVGALVGNASTYQMLATFLAGWNAAPVTIRNVGLYDSDETTLFAGSVFTSSAVQTDQVVQVEYNITVINA